MASILIEQCQVAPPPGGATELTLPLTYLDHIWFVFNYMRRIHFYKLPISKLDFVQNIIPSLKHSLSLTLKHYTPLAGSIACPLDTNGYPELRYVIGDSVSVTFSETDMDFNYLIGDHPRIAKDFYHFVPKLEKRPKDAPGVQLVPVLAIHVTLFPNIGISIGSSHHHAAFDGSTSEKFITAWALLNKFDKNEECLTNEFIPFYDRSIIKDPYGQGKTIWDEMKQNMPEIGDMIVTPPLDQVRGTFIMRRDDIVKLKNLILTRRPNLSYVTSFTVTCAYIWTCLLKSKSAIEEEMIDENVMENFGCVAECRSRLNPPLPLTYFGNCLVTIIAEAISHGDLVGKEGFNIAVEVIGEAIKKQMKDEELILNGDWYREFCAIDTKRTLSIAGSPKLNLYDVDFGWGKPKKIEFISIDSSAGISMSISKYRDSNGDLEVGLSLPKTRMSAFAIIFNHGLSFL